MFPDTPTPPTTAPVDTTKTTPTPPVTEVPPAETPATFGAGNLKFWNAWKVNPTSHFDFLMIGDSYTQGNYYTWRLRTKLLTEGFVDGGPGYCSFGRYDPTGLYSIDGSMDDSELTFSYDPLVWTAEKENTYGPCGYVTNTAANAAITVKGKVGLSALTIIYEKHDNAGSFRYRLNNGAWTTVDATSTTQDIGSVEINVSGLSQSVLDIQPLAAGEVFCGVLAKRTGNSLAMDKLGASGSTADMFAENALWGKSTGLLTPKLATIMFGTNELIRNVKPDEMKANVQNIIDKLRQLTPNCDILIMAPPETMYESEDPRAYKTADYGDMLYKLAIANKAAYINYAKVFGHFSQAQVDAAIIDKDRIHPGQNGSETIADTMFDLLNK